MKKLILLCSVLFIITACKQQQTDKRILAIEKSIEKNAMGMDIDYKPGKLDTTVIVNAKIATSDLEKEYDAPISTDWSKIIKICTTMYEEHQKNNNTEGYHYWKWEADHMKRLSKMKPAAVDYSVYKYTYTIKNLVNPSKERTTVVNYYYFNQADSLLGHLNDDRMNELKRLLIKSDTQPYRTGLNQVETGVTYDFND